MCRSAFSIIQALTCSKMFPANGDQNVMNDSDSISLKTVVSIPLPRKTVFSHASSIIVCKGAGGGHLFYGGLVSQILGALNFNQAGFLFFLSGSQAFSLKILLFFFEHLVITLYTKRIKRNLPF